MFAAAKLIASANAEIERLQNKLNAEAEMLRIPLRDANAEIERLQCELRPLCASSQAAKLIIANKRLQNTEVEVERLAKEMSH